MSAPPRFGEGAINQRLTVRAQLLKKETRITKPFQKIRTKAQASGKPNSSKEKLE
jgi:hypothetical protein